MVGNTRISLKTETGTGTKRDRISITKLCTTETGAWDSPSLIKHTLAHLGRYEVMVMLRAVWGDGILHYQFLDIPLSTLRLMSAAVAVPVGRRKGRQSLGADIVDSRSGDVLFHVHFDGADSKCQIRNLRVDRCRMLTEWDQAVIL